MMKVVTFVTPTGVDVIVQVSPWGFLIAGLLAFLVGYGLWVLQLSLLSGDVICSQHN